MCERENFGFWLVVFGLLMILGAVTFAADKIIYVDDDAVGANDGSSWQNAYNFLQDALVDANSAEKPIEIRVAQGIYAPDTNSVNPDGTGNGEATFQLINNVTIMGGYAGVSETDPNARDIEVYVTFLNGDLRKNDIDVNDPVNLLLPDRYDNSEVIVTGSNTDATAVLDGVTISGGYKPLIFYFRSPAGGAGMFISSGSPTLIDCTFTDNVTSVTGGTLFIRDDSNPNLINCKFARNYAFSGGGIYSSKNSSPTLINCIFSYNYVQLQGGGMYIADGNPTLTNCTFNRNVAFSPAIASATEGGGMYNRNSNPVLTNCTFSGNSATVGGGMNNRNSNPVLTNCTFSENSAESVGGMLNKDCNTELNMCTFLENTDHGSGAIGSVYGQLIAEECIFEKNYTRAVVVETEKDVIFTHCIFSGNSSPSFNGGAVLVLEATFNHCIFAGNRTTGDRSTGGAVFSFLSVTFNNCTFNNNWSETRRAIDIGAYTYVDNCIFWGSEDQIRAGDSNFPTTFVRYSDIQDGWLGEGNIDIDSCFVDPGYWADLNDTNIVVEPNDPNAVWIDGDYHLKSQAGRWDPNSQIWIQDDITSPCIDAGDPNSPIGDEPVPNGGIINMGAYGGTPEASKSPADLYR